MVRKLLLLILIHGSVHSFGQLSLGLKAGLNVNDIVVKDSPEGIKNNSKLNIGFHLGGYCKIKLSSKTFLVPEIQFSQRGVSDDSGLRLNVNYLELPLLLSYSPIKWVNVDLGPNVGFKISAIAKRDGSRNEINYNDLDFGLTTGAKFNLSDRISIIAHYYYGLASINEIYFRDINNNITAIAKEYNRNVQFGLGYKL